MTNDSPRVHYLEVDADQAGQRIDNFLLAYLKGVPRSYVYKILRKGEVRVNKGRAKAQQKLKLGDSVRIPPLRIPPSSEMPVPARAAVEQLMASLIYEDENLLAVNKPAGLAVHGGSGIHLGLIEILRHAYPELKHIELVHRLDRDTSGCLLVAKRRRALVDLQAQWRNSQVEKRYWAVVTGEWPKHRKIVEAPLLKNQLASGERMVRVHQEGKPAETRFKILQRLRNATLIEASPITGRTHQIRVHCQFAGHSILGDEKYGDNETNKRLRGQGIKRLCLHSRSLTFNLPGGGRIIELEAPIADDLQSIIGSLSDQNY